MTAAATTTAGPVSARVRAWSARAWARRWVRFVVIAAAVLVVLIVAGALWAAVPNLYPPYEPSPGEAPASPEVAAAHDATRSQAIVTTRASVLAAVAGLGALVTIAINARNSGLNARTLATTQDTFRVTERAHLTGRYTTAVEQIGHDSIAIRLGGIYALQQLAVDTDRDSDQATVVEVLSAFVRLNLHHHTDEPATPAEGSSPTAPSVVDLAHPTPTTPVPASTPRSQRWLGPVEMRRPLHPADSDPTPGTREPRADVLAAVSVLAQLPTRGVPRRADFAGLDFTGINLRNARLAQANLTDSSMFGVTLAGAALAHADLTNIDFTYADLTASDLIAANLSFSRLRDARFIAAELTGVNLTAADLTGANLSHANLSVGDLTRADLNSATLAHATLLGANLSGVNLAWADLTDAHLADANLTGANLTGAVLAGTDLTGADLSNATVSEESLASTRGRPARGVDGVAPAATD